jgi:hypothetical protein
MGGVIKAVLILVQKFSTGKQVRKIRPIWMIFGDLPVIMSGGTPLNTHQQRTQVNVH